MDSTLLLWIFLGVWIALVFLYILFKVCGGRLADCFSCDCFSGPCCDCWGAGGQVDAYDREYPFARDLQPPGRQAASLPPIVIVNDFDGRNDRTGRRRSGGTSEYDRYDRVENSDDIEYRDGAEGELDDESANLEDDKNQALLLRSRSDEASFGRVESASDSVVVV